MKNSYVGRTFISPSPTIRQLGIRLKLNPLRETIHGKRLIVVDDSYTLRVAPLLRRDDPVVQDWLVRFDGTPLRFPSDSPPGMGYLRRHRSRFEWAASL